MNPIACCDEPEIPLDLDQTELEEESAAMLYVAIVDAQLQLRAGLHVDIEGTGLRGSALTDDSGVLFVDGCQPGSYTIFMGTRAATVHTLTQRDLERCPDPYLSILR
jgi:protocatechuate 3,4-dioxygenase beta subunit